MRHHSYGALVFGAAAVALTAACGDQGVTPLTAPDAPAFSSHAVCEAVDFNGFGHGDGVTSVSLPTLGLTLNVTSAPFVHPNGDPNTNTTPRAFHTGVDAAVWEDKDLIDDSSGGVCENCGPLGRILVIEDERGFSNWGDYAYGGMLTLSGTFAGGDYYVQSFKAVDVDSHEEPVRLYVDGALTAQSGSPGNGTVQTVNVAAAHTISGSIAFELGTDGANYSQTGSGGIDDIMICRVEEQQVGDDGCTLGYWKQEHHLDSWVPTGLSPAQTLESVFDVPDSYGLDSNTLLEALDFKGGPGTTAAARLLLKQAVAALLNAEHPDVDYALTATQVLDQVNDALATGDRDTMLALAGQLDGYNNAGCPLS